MNVEQDAAAVAAPPSFFKEHHMNVLVGEGESGGHFGTAEVARLGIPMTVIIFLTTVCIEIPWWKLIGLIH